MDRGPVFRHLLPCASHESGFFFLPVPYQPTHIRHNRLEDTAGKSGNSEDCPDKNSFSGQICRKYGFYSSWQVPPSVRTPRPSCSEPEGIRAFRCTPDRYGYWALRRMRSDSRRKSLSLWKVQYALPDQSRSHTVFSSSDFPPFSSRICLRKYASLFFKSGCRTDNLLLLQAVSNQLDSDRKARL